MNNLISIIVPIYNCELFLDFCINSVLSQTFNNWQLLLINDGSTDNSLNICKKYAERDKRIKYFDLENQGVSNARNIGLDNAIGDFILFIDSDDWISKDTLEKVIDFQKLNQSDIILFSYYKSSNGQLTTDNYLKQNSHLLSDSNCIKHRVVGFFNEKIDEPTKTDAFNTPWAKLYKKSVIGNIRYIKRSEVGMEDVLFNIQVFNSASTFSYLDEKLYYYRLDNPNSLTKTDTKSLFSKFEKLFFYIENDGFYDYTYEENLNNRVSCLLINLCLSLTHRNNRMGVFEEYKYLKEVVNSKRYINSLKSFSISGLKIHWQLFFLFAKRKQITLLLLLSYLMRVLK
jgi:glycosyltransferase involved in cell wall biosynthesis